MKWMLKMDPAARPTAEQVLQHPWLEQSDRHVERKEATEERYEGEKPGFSLISRNTMASRASKENIPDRLESLIDKDEECATLSVSNEP
ncbi:hypothetical protein BT96DRAFT_507654 [Gymnopus androsaceus JB14]|uniref:Protein kinase domain-containing protein n=1 Tax=Gymnopus androsaceus JB14 TaxID=1447944 RepID=A0A6A4GM36_9AGAR|nr:hypothetical protein BT96DRAFT_507654 [Gymnopus androsaceus JB14]